MATTGDTTLPALGKLSYNTVDWSALYKSTLTLDPMPDEAKRATKAVRAKLEVDGFVTLRGTAKSTDSQMKTMRDLLAAPAGVLIYRGNGSGNLNVNTPGGMQDLEYGPVPKILFFQPLGAGRGAIVRWSVECVIPATSLGINAPVMQFNYESQVTYDDEGYSQIAMQGTLEIGVTRTAAFTTQIPDAVERFRAKWLDIEFDLVTGGGMNSTDDWRLKARDFAKVIKRRLSRFWPQ